MGKAGEKIIDLCNRPTPHSYKMAVNKPTLGNIEGEFSISQIATRYCRSSSGGLKFPVQICAIYRLIT